MAVNIVFGTVCLPEESFKRHFNLPGACFLPAWNYSRNKFNFPVAVVKLLLALAFTDYLSPSSVLLRNLLLFGVTPAVSPEKKPCKALVNYWHVETNAGGTCIAFSLKYFRVKLCTVGKNYLFVWRCSHVFCGTLLEMAEKAEFTWALLRGTWHLPQASSILFSKEI